MVMITCPRCGQHALDVASACPKCGHVLMQNPLETGDGTRLTSCRRCGKHIDRGAVLCPFCGHHARRSKLLRRGAWGLVATAAAVGGGVALARAGVLRSLPWNLRRAAPSAEVTGPPRQAPPPDTQVSAAPIVAAAPDTTPARADSAARQPRGEARATPALPPRASPASLRVKWTAEWANVREERSVDSPVVRVLAPGVRVEIGDPDRGWWAVFENDAVIGYIANSVLSESPPGP